MELQGLVTGEMHCVENGKLKVLKGVRQDTVMVARAEVAVTQGSLPSSHSAPV